MSYQKYLKLRKIFLGMSLIASIYFLFCIISNRQFVHKLSESEFEVNEPLLPEVPNPRSTKRDYLNASVFEAIDSTLERIYATSKKRNIMIIISNRDYDIVVVNWLCNLYNHVPELLNHVLLINTDQSHSRYFKSKGINSIHLNIDDVLKSVTIEKRLLWMARSLLTHYILLKGWNVMIIDSDAIVFRDPFLLLEEFDVDIIIGVGRFPHPIRDMWGFTGCAGTAIYKYAPNTKYLFDELSRRPKKEVDDQLRLNEALFAMNMTWVDHEDSNTHIGTSLRYQTRVAIVGEKLICRHHCKKILKGSKQLFIAHPGSKKQADTKMASAVSYSFMMVKNESVEFQEFLETSTSGWFKTVCLST